MLLLCMQLALTAAADPSTMSERYEKIVKPCSAQLKASACAGSLPKALVFAEKEVATNSMKPLQLRVSPTTAIIKIHNTHITRLSGLRGDAAHILLVTFHRMATKTIVLS
jgi:hypothetical protein